MNKIYFTASLELFANLRQTSTVATRLSWKVSKGGGNKRNDENRKRRVSLCWEYRNDEKLIWAHAHFLLVLFLHCVFSIDHKLFNKRSTVPYL